MEAKNIRNFSIIAHIDHGKSTLADRLMELTGSVKTVNRKQLLDSMDLEQERGITIKLKAIRLFYKVHQLNLIDTPGHVDFGYEVSRALAACEGALLLVDASQGVQAQTIVNLEKARAQNLKIIPVINKIDLSSANREESILQIIDLGFNEKDVVCVSAKTGEGVNDLLEKIVEVIPSPSVVQASSENLIYNDGITTGEHTGFKPFSKALVFDSYFDDYRGIIAFIKIESGILKKNDVVRFIATNAETRLIEVGCMTPTETLVDFLSVGEVGFVATGLKDIAKVRVGDTLTLRGQNVKPIKGYKEPIPVVFLSFYPEDTSNYLKLREAMDKLNLSDAAFTFQPENIGAIGKGFRCGFLGLLHADIIRERIEREFGIRIIATSPSVRYEIETTKGKKLEIKSASEYPEPSVIKSVKEPWVEMSIYTTAEYISSVMDLCKKRRTIYIRTEYLEGRRVKVSYNIPLIELIIDFNDKLKSVSSGYASLDYKAIEYKETDVCKMDIVVAGDVVFPLAQLVQRKNAQEEGKRIVAKLKNLIPRQQFKVSLQASIGGKILARENISPVRKDVTGHLYGGDITRKMKLLEKQKKGKKRMKRFGNVEIPQDVFWKVMTR